ncbi:hypothetical protein NMY22_g5084 [Coprinellus aureogranulatus]|nr:hypothetical protein NMY22_g5084 [Coprinellus aureogranulatus]
MPSSSKSLSRIAKSVGEQPSRSPCQPDAGRDSEGKPIRYRARTIPHSTSALEKNVPRGPVTSTGPPYTISSKQRSQEALRMEAMTAFPILHDILDSDLNHTLAPSLHRRTKQLELHSLDALQPCGFASESHYRSCWPTPLSLRHSLLAIRRTTARSARRAAIPAGGYTLQGRSKGGAHRRCGARDSEALAKEPSTGIAPLLLALLSLCHPSTSSPMTKPSATTKDTTSAGAQGGASKFPPQTSCSKEYYLEGGDLWIIIDTTYVRVHSSFFVGGTSFFTSFLDAGQKLDPSSLPGTGRPENAIIIRIASLKEFERFCWIFYNDKFDDYSEATIEDWFTILRLAHTWGFDTVKAMALRYIKQKEHEIPNVVDRIVMYEKYSPPVETLLPLYVELCKRVPRLPQRTSPRSSPLCNYHLMANRYLLAAWRNRGCITTKPYTPAEQPPDDGVPSPEGTWE